MALQNIKFYLKFGLQSKTSKTNMLIQELVWRQFFLSCLDFFDQIQLVNGWLRRKYFYCICILLFYFDTVRGRAWIPNIQIPNPFENWTFNGSDHSKTELLPFENLTFQNGRFSQGRFIYKHYFYFFYKTV